jgi:hypothetical protein
MVLRSIAILLVGAALGAGLQYAAGAPHRTSGSVETNGIASTFNLHRESIITANHGLKGSASLEASEDNSHIYQIRRAHIFIQKGAVGSQPPTF